MQKFVDHCVNCADAEQRGYDRAIAEVVAWLRIDGEAECNGIAIADAIEAGEHLGGVK